MNTFEKVGAVAGVVIAAFTVGAGYNALNNRIDRVDEKIGAIQNSLGSTACTAILTRQIEAIEKGRAEARKALEGLSKQYGCVPRQNVDASTLAVDWGETLNASTTSNLTVQLNAVDVLLNEETSP